ncbi:hypothetical protein [Acetonema longum]|uniref:Uncharacterized protein n=1 Tax=Acetonema longum DSM 6540 TaxID=1009370 RepID=F7NQG5_9FIRM|nr:hypothetical protein [Acetonema longum]EGO61743.1 hypothetical protein ALO_21821 [Acetonema longum DSM 6540]
MSKKKDPMQQMVDKLNQITGSASAAIDELRQGRSVAKPGETPDTLEDKAAIQTDFAAVKNELLAELATARTELISEITTARSDMIDKIANGRTELEDQALAIQNQLADKLASIRTLIDKEDQPG